MGNVGRSERERSKVAIWNTCRIIAVVVIAGVSDMIIDTIGSAGDIPQEHRIVVPLNPIQESPYTAATAVYELQPAFGRTFLASFERCMHQLPSKNTMIAY